MTGPKIVAARAGLGIRPRLRVWVAGHDIDAKRALAPLLSDVMRPAEGPVELAFICPETLDEATYFKNKVLPRLVSGGTAWFVCSANTPAGRDALARAGCDAAGSPSPRRVQIGGTVTAIEAVAPDHEA